MSRVKLLQKYFSILIIILIHSQFVLAESSDSNNSRNNKTWQLWAKPRICVMPSNLLMCEMETDFNWIGVEQADICLLSSQEGAILQCWPYSVGGHLFQQISSDKQITYWLSRSNDDEVLVKTIIHIVTIPQRSVRRRRRHIWSLL